MIMIEFLRRKKGLNQSQLGELIGVTTQTISNWETEKLDPPVSRYKQLAKVFDLENWTELTKEV